MTNIVEVKKAYKFYGGTTALDFIDLDIKKGNIVGLLGPNGSGKTTLLKVIANVIHPESGEIFVDGKKVGIETRKIVSYLPDNDFLLKWMTLNDAIKFYEDFFEDFSKEKMMELLNFMELDSKLGIKVKDLSKGMREKFNLSLILARDAEVYLLDEPIGGVDIITRDNILESIINTFVEGKTIIITTHLVSELEKILDEAVFIKDGKIILQGNCDDLRMEYGTNIEGVYRQVYRGV